MPEGKTNPEKYTIETESFKLAIPTKTGYEFIGWTESNGEEAEKEVTIEKGTTGNKECGGKQLEKTCRTVWTEQKWDWRNGAGIWYVV